MSTTPQPFESDDDGRQVVVVLGCSNRHRRQALLVEPDDSTPRWTCQDCGALMDTDHPDRTDPTAVRSLAGDPR